MKQWRCTICGHIHTGENPPEVCPICGATKDKFVQIVEEKTKGQRETITKADILVVGSGAAAFSAAITAKSLGASVIMLEKAPKVGGTTARSGGGFWVPLNRHQREYGITDTKEDAIAYMARYSYSHLFDPGKPNFGLPEREYSLLETYVENACEMTDYFDKIGALNSVMEINWTGKPQVDYMDHLPENKEIRGRSIYPKDKEGNVGSGSELIRQLESWAQENEILVYTNCEVSEIVQDQEGKVVGVKAKIDEEVVTFTAGKGVVFGSGGYSHNPEMMLQFQRGPHYGGCAVPTNTGDFIKMAGSVGAQLGNMAGAFRANSMLEVYLGNPDGSSNVFYLPGDSMLLVNKYGRRIVDEKRNYTDRTMTHFVWDPQRAEWSNLLTFMLFDERTLNLWKGYPPYPVNKGDVSYIIEGKNLEDLTDKLKDRLQILAPQIGGFQLDSCFEINLKKTMNRFNEFAQTGVDLDFQRGEFLYDREWTTFPPTNPQGEWPQKNVRNYTMYPMSDKGPYYAIIFAAGTLDTNGGPVINRFGQILNWNNKPIKGLYGAGNCIASPTANAYWGAGSTIGPALTFGYICAKHIMGR